MSDCCGGRRLLSLLLLVATLCAGCVSSRGLAKSSVQFNQAVEQGQNQMLLLNILRASYRRPMYLTSFSKVTGDNSASFSAGFNNVDGDTLGGSFGTNPTFDVPVLDSQEFTNGFLKPVDPRVLAYYWDQDWPEDFLLHLLVHKVRVRVKTKIVVKTNDVVNDAVENKEVVRDYYFWNHPDLNDAIQGKGLCKLEKFTRWVRHFTVTANPGFQKVDPEPIGPAFQAHQVDLENAIALTKEGLSLRGDDNRLTFDLKPAPTEYVLQVEGDLRGARGSESLPEEDRRELALETIAEWAEDSRGWACDEDEFESYSVVGEEEHQHGEESSLKSESERAGGGEASEVSVALFLRSPEAILYYLGQLVRIEERLGWVPRICVGHRLEPLFVARQADPGCARGPINVEYDYRWYTVPGNPGESRRLDPKIAHANYSIVQKAQDKFEASYKADMKQRVAERAKLLNEENAARKGAKSAKDLEEQLDKIRQRYRAEIEKRRGELRAEREKLRASYANSPELACFETDVFWPTAAKKEDPVKKEEVHLYQEGLGCEPGRSMQALSLVTQIINLQKSAKDLPTTGTVRVVGQ